MEMRPTPQAFRTFSFSWVMVSPTRDLREGFSPKQAQARLQERYHVSPMRAQMAVDCAQASRAAELSLAPDQVSVYVGARAVTALSSREKAALSSPGWGGVSGYSGCWPGKRVSIICSAAYLWAESGGASI